MCFWCICKGDITDLAVSSNNTFIASASNDCVIRVVSFLYRLCICFHYDFYTLASLTSFTIWIFSSGDCQMAYQFRYFVDILELLLLLHLVPDLDPRTSFFRKNCSPVLLAYIVSFLFHLVNTMLFILWIFSLSPM